MNRYLKILRPCLALIPIFFIGSLAITIFTLANQLSVYRSWTLIECLAPNTDQTSDAYAVQLNTFIQIALLPDVILATRHTIARPSDEISAILSRISAEPVKDTRLIRLTVDSVKPVFAAQFANTWASTFIAQMKTDGLSNFRQIEQALPGGAPITPRKMQTIYTASINGLVTGGALSLALAAIITATTKHKSANKKVQLTAFPESGRS